MNDLGENPARTIWSATCDLVKWWFVIVGTWGVGLWLGIWIESGHLPSLMYTLGVLWTSLIVWLIYPIVLLGLGTSALAWCLPLKIDSRKLAIGAAVVNLTVWTGIGAYLSWSWSRICS
jgi:hypothetical protein